MYTEMFSFYFSFPCFLFLLILFTTNTNSLMFQCLRISRQLYVFFLPSVLSSFRNPLIISSKHEVSTCTLTCRHPQACATFLVCILIELLPPGELLPCGEPPLSGKLLVGELLPCPHLLPIPLRVPGCLCPDRPCGFNTMERVGTSPVY